MQNPRRRGVFQMQSNAHRLSRFPQRYISKPSLNETTDTFAESYFKMNPEEAQDMTPPETKLERIESSLAGELEPSAKFSALMQQKAMRYVIYGDDSVEMLRSYAALGFFYNENNRPESAIRNLTLAHQMESKYQLEEEESMTIALETAEAYLNLKPKKKSESSKNVSKASAAIEPYNDYEVEDQSKKSRLYVVRARIHSALQEYEDSVQCYDVALESKENTEDQDAAVLYSELGEVAEKSKQLSKAKAAYKKAYDIFVNLELNDQARYLEDKINIEIEEEEQNENNKQNENDQEEEQQNVQEENNDDEQIDRHEDNEKHEEEKEEFNDQESNDNGDYKEENTDKDYNTEENNKNDEKQEEETQEKLEEEEKKVEAEENIEENNENDKQQEEETQENLEEEKQDDNNEEQNSLDQDDFDEDTGEADKTEEKEDE